MRGLRLAYGSWKTICIWRRILRTSASPRRVSSLPCRRTLPPVGLWSWRMARPVVLLPQPDSPTRPSVSPCLIANDTPSTARTVPTWRWKIPLVIGKWTWRLSTRNSSPTAVPLVGTCIGRVVVVVGIMGPLDGLRGEFDLRVGAASNVDPAGDAVAWHDGLQARVLGHAPLDGVRAA